MSDNYLTDEEVAKLNEYLDKVEALKLREPKPLSADIWDKVWPQIQKTGKIPAKYRDRIGVKDVTTGKHHFKRDRLIVDDGTQTIKGYYDIEHERWNEEMTQLNAEYHDVNIKAVRIILTQTKDDTQTIVDMLRQLIAEKKVLPAIISHELKEIDLPVDKVNKNIWNLLEYNTDGQVTMAKYDVSVKGSDDPVDILFSLAFADDENVLITRKLEPYDKRVYVGIGAIYHDGYDVMSIQQIYNGMGYKGRAGASDIKKINASISKMSGAHLYIDNLAEVNNHYKYDHFSYDASLLPMERVHGIFNGQIVDTAIRVFREPPMLSFARARNQITPIRRVLLDTPLNKTNSNIALEDYLLEEIAHIKNGYRSNKMLFDTIYKNTKITATKQKQRAPEKIKLLLDHYVACGYIKGYEPNSLKDLKKADGFTISY